jgi:hypothetical protein
VPNFEGIGDITDDLRDRLDSVLGKSSTDQAETPRPRRDQAPLDPKALQARRRERQQRRDRRRASTKR